MCVEKEIWSRYFPSVMLDDRPYMRSPSYEPRVSWTTILLLVNAGIFFLQKMVEFHGGVHPIPGGSFEDQPWLFRFFYLSLEGLKHFYVWQLFTFQFLHANLWHLLGNSIVIFFFGRSIEEALGRREFLKLYLASGVVGGLFQTLLAVVTIPFGLHQYFGGYVLGASAGGFGLVAAFATLFPDRMITLLVFFVLPISFRARTLLWLAIAISTFGILVPESSVADGAHLGGIGAGVAYIHWIIRGGWSFSIAWPSSRSSRRQTVELVRTASAKKGFWSRPKKAVETDDLPPAEFISREVDPILDKISAHGIQSLTDRERKVLEAARAKMAKR
jgi:membrane associated rhomboid family serine protease